ncbi:MAG: type IV pilus twitching motility protein PilT [Candidatus Aureabacteria bacterium]|mgnify:FL=1|nr:type IV pilus twitching motility protein PilT [Candidatus Auribacterota bacterium]NLW93587.1 type IV pilus twitching motility protein PilT [Chlamydiota bacterium]HOE27683.1 type IV pilus twitching motility protein PilT [bacterium]HQM53707.1 type IV pilus twitching motility protein PilT [bacterium]
MVEMKELLERTVAEGASDLHICVGCPPTIRLHGGLIPLEGPPLGPVDTERLVKGVTSDQNQEKLRTKGGADFGFSFGDQARFRVSVYKQKGSMAMALRLIPNRLLTLEEIGLPAMIKTLLYKPRGLILVTGPTGSGKTTTLASMLNVINQERDCHILTIEDPIEYYHDHAKSVVTQREVGVDVPDFSDAIVHGLRQDPDVILVGEMRDLQTMEAAISAAETGHLVFATLHTTGAGRTMDRIIDAFPTGQQGQIRSQLSQSIVAVISQLLLPKLSGSGRVAPTEIMIATPSIQNLIRENKTFRIQSDIQTGARHGMRTLDMSLMNLYQQGTISYESMMNAAQDPEQILIQIGGR